MINIIITSLLLISCNIFVTLSATTTKTINNAETATILSKTTEGPLLINKLKMTTPTEAGTTTTLDPLELQLKDIFVVNFVPKSQTTEGPFLPPDDEFDSVEVKSIKNGPSLGLGRRTNFRTPLNCRCVINNRCARTNSCKRNKRQQKQTKDTKK